MYALLWLEGNMQSFGVDSKFLFRGTLNFPTKSAIIGMTLSALGLSGEQRDNLKKFSEVDFTVFSFSSLDVNGEKINKESLLNDFQVIGNGYDSKDPWESLFIPRMVDGKKPVNASGKIVSRDYLQDSFFGVIFEIPKDFEEYLEDAFVNPKFDIFLGRKCCIPKELVFQGVFNNFDDTFKKMEDLSLLKNLVIDFKVSENYSDDCFEKIVLNDVPVSFGVRREYSTREVFLSYH